MSQYLAIDIVVLPPDDVMDRAIALNEQYETNFTLSKSSCLPHITLSQAVIPKANLKQVESELRQMASDFEPLKLTADLSNTHVLMFAVRENRELTRLHHSVMDKLQKLVSYDAKSEYFYGEEVSDKTVDWVRNFLTNSAYDKYNPHITLSVSTPSIGQETIQFTASRLAVCHLGNYNTCRKIIAEIRL